MEADFRLIAVTAPDIQTEVRDNQPIRGSVQISLANKSMMQTSGVVEVT